MDENSNLIPIERIESKIYIVRKKKVMLDRDLALLYGVSTKALNQAVKRNIERFPEDFMFRLSLNEAANLISQSVISSLRSQSVTLNQGQHLKYAPYAFTELGISMLSSVLKSSQAISVNIQIMRTFVYLRQMLLKHSDLQLRLDDLERRYDKQFKIIFDAMRKLITQETKDKPEIGFRLT